MEKKLKQRVPVIYRGKPLMPTRWGRAKRFEREGRGKLKYDSKLGIMYLKLINQPSDTKTQNVTIGVDPGTHFDGISVCSEGCHHENVMLTHNRGITERKNKQRNYRRIRRSNKRQRPVRFENRTKKGQMPATAWAMLNFRIWTIDRLCTIYPISECVVEDVSYNHWNDRGNNPRRGSSFSLAEVGKTKLYEYLKSKFNHVKIWKGYFTASSRRSLFSYLGYDPKSKNKAEKSFFSQCIDSFVLSISNSNVRDIVTKFGLNLKVRAISKVWFNRRELYQFKSRYKDKKWFKHYVPLNYKPTEEDIRVGGIQSEESRINGKLIIRKFKYFIKWAKPNTVRVQKYPNSWREFNYVKVHGSKEVECFHMFRKRYGGEVYNGISKKSKWRNLDTNQTIHPTRVWHCRHIGTNLSKFQLLGFKNQYLEIYGV